MSHLPEDILVFLLINMLLFLFQILQSFFEKILPQLLDLYRLHLKCRVLHSMV